MSITVPNSIKLTEVYSDMEAAMIVAALEQHGIESHMTGEFTSQFRAESLGNVNILVRETDLVEAQKVLKDLGNQEDSDSIEKEKSDGFSIRNVVRIVIIIGLFATALSMLVRIIILVLAEL